MSVDAIVVGAGLAGCVVARELAERSNKKVLVLEERDYVGGNIYDYKDDAGIYCHKFGPHIFHTNIERVYEYCSRFTEWTKLHHVVLANVHGKYIPVPFNLNSLHMVYEEEKATRIEKKLIEKYGENAKIGIIDLKKDQDPELQELSQYVYENIFLYYTMKQWGQKPEDIDPAVTARIPVYTAHVDGYFTDKYEAHPKHGYTKMIENMLNHPNIQVRFNSNAKQILKFEKGQSFFEGQLFNGIVVYTGAIDELFDCKFGRLPYRTLRFEFETLPVTKYQPASVVNYTVDQPYTRVTEMKGLTKQEVEGVTTIIREYSLAYEAKEGQFPMYPINNPDNQALYQKYVALAKEECPNVYFAGRLALYKYFNMDLIVDASLKLADELCQ